MHPARENDNSSLEIPPKHGIATACSEQKYCRRLRAARQRGDPEIDRETFVFKTRRGIEKKKGGDLRVVGQREQNPQKKFVQLSAVGGGKVIRNGSVRSFEQKLSHKSGATHPLRLDLILSFGNHDEQVWQSYASTDNLTIIRCPIQNAGIERNQMTMWIFMNRIGKTWEPAYFIDHRNPEIDKWKKKEQRIGSHLHVPLWWDRNRRSISFQGILVAWPQLQEINSGIKKKLCTISSMKEKTMRKELTEIETQV